MELIKVPDKKFANKKCFGKDFSNMDLTNADFRNATLVECSFKNSDLSYANFKEANCFGADFTDSILYKVSFENANLAQSIFAPKRMFGITITMECDTFDKMKISKTALLYWMHIATLMEAPDKEMNDRLITAIGEKNYLALSRIFREEILS